MINGSKLVCIRRFQICCGVIVCFQCRGSSSITSLILFGHRFQVFSSKHFFLRENTFRIYRWRTFSPSFPGFLTEFIVLLHYFSVYMEVYVDWGKKSSLNCISPFLPHWGAPEPQIHCCSFFIPLIQPHHTVLISHKIDCLCTLNVFKIDTSIISQGASHFTLIKLLQCSSM